MYGSNYNPTGAPIPPVPFDQPKSLYRFGELSLWSTFLLAGGGAIANSVNRLFTTPRGQVGQGFANALTLAETSLKEGGRVPAGVAYDVFGVSAQLLKSTAAADGCTLSAAIDTAVEIADLVNIQNNGILQWNFTQTTVDICPVYLAGSGGGTGGSISTGNAADLGNMNNGFGQIWMYRKHPVALPGNSTFAIELTFGSRSAAISANSVAVRVCLLGYYKNVIEIG